MHSPAFDRLWETLTLSHTGWSKVHSFARPFVAFLAVGSIGVSTEWVSGILWPEPVVINSGPLNGPPSDAIVLFNGTALSQWENGETWSVQDGYASPRSGDIRTKAVLDDCQ